MAVALAASRMAPMRLRCFNTSSMRATRASMSYFSVSRSLKPDLKMVERIVIKKDNTPGLLQRLRGNEVSLINANPPVLSFCAVAEVEPRYPTNLSHTYIG